MSFQQLEGHNTHLVRITYSVENRLEVVRSGGLLEHG